MIHSMCIIKIFMHIGQCHKYDKLVDREINIIFKI